MPSLTDVTRGALSRDKTADAVATHKARFGDGDVRDVEGAARYYDLVTDFYEYGWGESFHFAPRFSGESFAASLARLEHKVALRLGIGPTHTAIDIGCGVGGPMRSITRFSGADVTGLTINGYQVEKANRHNAAAGLAERCRAVQGDYHDIPHKENSFDAAYSFEAICHSERRHKVLNEMRRVVRPGGLVAGTDWCLTADYDDSQDRHRHIRRLIEEGNGLAPMLTVEAFRESFAQAGLELLEFDDLANHQGVPWYRPLQAGWTSTTELRRTAVGRTLTHTMVTMLEGLRIAPSGTRETSAMLNRAADGLVAGGEDKLFTPLVFFVARVA
jgi:sterol 24-C-methyltransferase